MNQNEHIFIHALKQHKEKLYRLCMAYASDEIYAQDLFQEALIQIWKSMPSFKSQAAIGTWMYRITVNVCLRLHENLKRKQKVFKRFEGIDIEDIPQPDEKELNPLIKLLNTCIDELNAIDKSIILLHLEQLPYKQIAEITELSENHIAVKVKRIKQKLLTCINEKS